MLHSGLVSVSFRAFSAEEIIALVVKAGLKGIEWGGDIHVPHGDVKRAAEVGRMTGNAGLKTAAYGSYYIAGREGQGTVPFEKVLESAVALKAPTIRIWAGDRGSGEADAAWRSKVTEDSRHIAALAEKEGITISFEYHRDTLTDTPESAYALLKGINHKNIRTYWQQNFNEGLEAGLKSIDTVTPWLSNIHVNRLADGFNEWQSYVNHIKGIDGERFIMLEFVKNNDPEAFLKDAEALKQLLAGMSANG